MSLLAGLLALLPQVLDAVKVPVIAAGGVVDSRQPSGRGSLNARRERRANGNGVPAVRGSQRAGYLL